MRILVIGGTGFIGPAVVHSLIESGHDNDVTLFHRGQTEADFAPEVKHIHCNDVPPAHLGWKIQGLPDFVSEFSSFAPDVVLDMVPIGEQDAQVVMNTFRGIAGRVVALSSEDVYRAYDRLRRSDPGPPDPTPLTEDSPLREKYYPYRSNPLRSLDDPSKWQDEYDKILAERVVMSDPALPGTILRLPMVYGPRDYQHRLFEYLKRMDDQRPAILLDETIANWRWTRGYVEDVAQAIVLAVTQAHAAHRIYNVGEPHALSIAEWVRAIGNAAGWHGEIIAVPQDRLPTHMVMGLDTSQDWQVDTTRIRQELGYSEAIPSDEALKRTIAWERAHPPHDIDPEQFDYAAEDALLTQLK